MSDPINVNEMTRGQLLAEDEKLTALIDPLEEKRKENKLNLAESKEYKARVDDRNLVRGALVEMNEATKAESKDLPDGAKAEGEGTEGEGSEEGEGDKPAEGDEKPEGEGDGTDTTEGDKVNEEDVQNNLDAVAASIGDNKTDKQDLKAGIPEAKTAAIMTTNTDGSKVYEEMSPTEFGAKVLDLAERQSGSNEGQMARVASVRSFDLKDTKHVSTANTALQNMAVIDELKAQKKAKAAAICGPIDVRRDMPECLNVKRYVRDIWTSVPADRGAIQVLPEIGLASVTGGVTIWNDTLQTAVDESDTATWKPCITVACASASTITTGRIASCVKFERLQRLSSPEHVASTLRALAAQTARVADGEILRIFDSFSAAKTYTNVAQGGSFPSALDITQQSVGAIASKSRNLSSDIGVTLIAPDGFLQNQVLDLAFASGVAPSEAVLQTVIDAHKALGVSQIVITPDFTTESSGTAPGGTVNTTAPYAGVGLPAGGAAATAFTRLPCKFQLRYAVAEDFLFFDAGSFDVNIETSPELSRQNMVQGFGEVFEGFGKYGCNPSLTVTATLAASGVRSGFAIPVNTVVPLVCA